MGNNSIIKRVLASAGKVLLLVLTVATVLLAVEGLSSLLFIARKVDTLPPVDGHRMKERRHTRYDPLLGWVNIPNLRIADMYAPGVEFITNSRGFRNEDDFDEKVPPGRRRIICTGDSLTMGFGVGNEEAWCRRLAALDPRLETLNMGQGGYGIDQAFLWYHRDGVKVDHDIHLFAFIIDDIFRIQRGDFWGYGKPVLRVVDDELVPVNTPVRKKFYRWPKIEFKIQRYLSRLNFSKVLTGKDPGQGFDFRNRELLTNDEVLEVTMKIFEALKEDAERRNAALVLVLLPLHFDAQDFSIASWRAMIRRKSREIGVTFIDLVDIIRKELPPEKWKPLFHDPVTEHYTAEGHDYIASLLLERLHASLSFPDAERIPHPE